MNYERTLEKLQKLVNLIELTENNKPSEEELFEQHKIDVYSMMNHIKDLSTGRLQANAAEERAALVDTMKNANRIWRIRNKIKNGEYSTVNYMDDEIKEYLIQGHKIAAIKFYRSELKNVTGTAPSLKESKEYVDVIQAVMESKGLL